MINYKSSIAKIIKANIDFLTEEEIASMIEIPSNEKMGDYAFPCFKLAKELKKAPPQIASELAEKIAANELFEKVEQVGPYLNMFLQKEQFVKELVYDVNKKGEDFAKNDIGSGKTVIVEFSSPNIAKPFHIGHIRSTVIGNSIYKIFESLGYDVVRINHLGDYGTQFGKMISAYRRWGNKADVEREPIKTLLGYYTKFHEEAEKDPSLEQEARDIFARLEKGEKEEVELWKWFRDESLKEFARVYDMLGISFDSYAGESFYSDKMQRILDELKEKGLLQKSQGAEIVVLTEYGMTPALVTKSDGSTLYITRDIAAAVYRKETYDFYKNIYVVASQQNLHFQQWFKIVELLGYDWAKDCVHVPFGMVSLKDGTMSTRKGRVVFLEDVLNKAVEKTREIILEKGVTTGDIDEIAKEVGIGAVMFNELTNNRIKDYVFDWEQVLNFDGETGPYVQYTHARTCSLLRKAGEEMATKAENLQNFDAKYLVSESAYALAKLIHRMPEVISEAAVKYEPSIVTRHTVDIAQAFNRFYQSERIITDNEDETLSKLALVAATKNAIKCGLSLLGVKAPERM